MPSAPAWASQHVPPTNPNSPQSKGSENQELSAHASGAHVCLYCHGKIPLLARWRGLRDFCSDQHQQLYWGETQRLAADAIRRQRISRRFTPEIEVPPPAEPETPELTETDVQSAAGTGESGSEAELQQGLLALSAVTADADSNADLELDAATEHEANSDAGVSDAHDQDADLPFGSFRIEAAVLMEISLPAPLNQPARPHQLDPTERATPKGGTEVEIPQTDFDPVVAEANYAPVEAWLQPLPQRELAPLAAATAHVIEPTPIDNADLATLASWLQYPVREVSPEEEPPFADPLEIPLASVAPERKLAPEFPIEDSTLSREPQATCLYATRSEATVKSPSWFPQQEMVPIFREVLGAEIPAVRPRAGMNAAEQLARCILPVGVNESEEPRELNSTEARSAARTPMGGPATCRFELVNHVMQQRTLRLRRAGIRQLGTYIPQMRLRTLRPRLVRRRWEGPGASVVKMDGPIESIQADA